MNTQQDPREKLLLEYGFEYDNLDGKYYFTKEDKPSIMLILSNNDAFFMNVFYDREPLVEEIIKLRDDKVSYMKLSSEDNFRRKDKITIEKESIPLVLKACLDYVEQRSEERKIEKSYLAYLEQNREKVKGLSIPQL